MSSSPNAEEGSGSPPLSGNGNAKAAAGALPTSSNTAPTSNGNGHGYPRSGVDSPTNVFRIEHQNKLLLKLMNIEPGQAVMATKFAKGSLLEGEREIDIITNVYGLNQTSLLAVHTYHLLLSRITERGTYPVIKSKRRLPDHAVVMRRQFYQKVMPLFYQKYAHLFGEDTNNHLVDYANTMFSFVDFTVTCTDEQKKEMLLELSAEEASTVARKASVSLSLKPADADLLLQDHSGISCNLEFYDASILRFSELATSHYVAEKL
uniref:Uncharacterized protein n=1 Tax=Panagrolaimus davidi TaxID=227884 RepID=A0A914Q5X6_9BILA